MESAKGLCCLQPLTIVPLPFSWECDPVNLPYIVASIIPCHVTHLYNNVCPLIDSALAQDWQSAQFLGK